MIKQKTQGFTLIEVMIVVAIIAIIAAIAYPSYQNYVKRTNRAEVQSYLMELSHKLASYKLVNRSYKDVSMSTIGGNAVFPKTNGQTYNISLTDSVGAVLGSGSENGTTWRLLATPVGRQVGDGAISLTDTNQQCWYKGKDSPQLQATIDADGNPIPADNCVSWESR